MFIEVIVLMLTSLISISLVGKAWEGGYLGGNLGRAFAGGSLGIVSNKFLVGYTQFESVIGASFRGVLGFSGYFFLAGLSLLILVWITNFIEYRVLIQ